MMGKLKLESAASSRMASRPVIPGIINTAPAPACLAACAREIIKCAGALMHGAYRQLRPVSAFA